MCYQKLEARLSVQTVEVASVRFIGFMTKPSMPFYDFFFIYLLLCYIVSITICVREWGWGLLTLINIPNLIWYSYVFIHINCKFMYAFCQL